VSCDPRLDEFIRANELRPAFFRNVQTHIKNVVIPQLEELAALRVEVEALRAQTKRSRKTEPEAVHAGT
jgi:hypothetical protein